MRCNRKTELVEKATNYVKSQIPEYLNLDYNSDGEVDNICFIIRGQADLGELLWPSRDNMSPIAIDSVNTHVYNLLIENYLGAGYSYTLYHEMFHTIGAPDLYNGSYPWFPIIGFWDLMASEIDPPPSMCTYMKYKYGKWISSIPEITQSGHYTLNPITASSNNCYRIPSSDSSEYFVLEFRKMTGTFESSVYGTGLVIYRINTNLNVRNYSGPPYEVYVYRKDGSLEKQ